MKLLLIEDDLTLNQLTTKALKKMKFSVDQAYNGEEGWEMYLENTYDVIVLDLNLPYLSGLDLLKKIRIDDVQTKVLILSANSSIEDKLLGFNLGATDYLTKPFDILELGVRIDNLLRWKFQQQSPEISLANLILNQTEKMFYFEDTSLSLTRKEYGILEYLMKNLTTYVTPEEIIEHVWESDAALFSNAFKYHVHQLRKKLYHYCNDKIIIKSKRGYGYNLQENHEGNV
ncbi:response regulator transcription factor [Lactococcus formosensis]|uniref:response regulator transcription factor n=1 Tax=Lactococcus formosensis TaxID=1281486 RepID=UPI00324366E1